MKMNWKSLIFVLIQFFSLGYIALTGPLFPASTLLFALELGGLFLGIWAVITMRMGNFNIAPEPLSWSKLVQFGPYRVIRHPMYLALLVTTIPLVINSFTPARWSVWVILTLTLLLKMGYEEDLLSGKFPGYRQYINETSKIIPGVF